MSVTKVGVVPNFLVLGTIYSKDINIMSTKRKTTECFIEEAIKIHGDKYDYSKVEYVNNKTKVCIICPEHGEFWQTPKQHIKGQGCPKCGLKKISLSIKGKTFGKITRIRREHINNKHSVPRNIKTTEQFIEQSIKIHGDKYDYSKVAYRNKTGYVTIICRKHGEFKQKAKYHLMGRGCVQCGREMCSNKQKYTNEEFIEKLKQIYGDKYDYSKVKYTNRRSKVILICPKHGEFTKIAADLLTKKTGCHLCNQEHKKEVFSLGKEKFIEKANNVFHNLYDYSNVIYVNNSTKVEIQCRKHGSFLCTPQNHLHGRGCPICKSENYVYEDRLYNFLKTIFREEDIIRQYRVEWLSNNKSLDFFIPKYNLCIEHQGSQHYNLTRYKDDNEEKLNKRIQNDIDKYNECISNGVNILYFTYELNKTPENCFHELILHEKELKEKIINLIEI